MSATLALQKDMHNRLTKGSVLVVHAQRTLRSSVKSVLRAMGASNVQVADTYKDAFEMLTLRSFNFIFFENAKGKGADSPADFAKKVDEKHPETILIAMFEPARVEDLFTCLQAGVRGFVVIPCTPGALEQTLLKAIEGLKIPAQLLEGDSWNMMFAKFVMKQLDQLCEVVQQSREDVELVSNVKNQMTNLKDAVQMGKAYSEGGDQGFLQELYSQCSNLAEDKRTRLKKVRDKLAKERGKSAD